jgi:hypothetical protein
MNAAGEFIENSRGVTVGEGGSDVQPGATSPHCWKSGKVAIQELLHFAQEFDPGRVCLAESSLASPETKKNKREISAETCDDSRKAHINAQ